MCRGHYPDGLTEAVIDRLLDEVSRSVVPVSRSVSPFALADVDVRRERRERNRRLALVSRLYPAGGFVAGVAA